MHPDRHIILLGFKHVGKSTLARKLAWRLHKPWVDLDKRIEQAFAERTASRLTCRQIVQQYGQDYFRELEASVLRRVLDDVPSVISLGGGTPLLLANQVLIAPHIVIHVTANRDIVYKRIMRNGLPAFFSTEEDPRTTFARLWQEREKEYTRLAQYQVDNTRWAPTAVKQIVAYLNTVTFAGTKGD